MMGKVKGGPAPPQRFHGGAPPLEISKKSDGGARAPAPPPEKTLILLSYEVTKHREA